MKELREELLNKQYKVVAYKFITSAMGQIRFVRIVDEFYLRQADPKALIALANIKKLTKGDGRKLSERLIKSSNEVKTCYVRKDMLTAKDESIIRSTGTLTKVNPVTSVYRPVKMWRIEDENGSVFECKGAGRAMEFLGVKTRQSVYRAGKLGEVTLKNRKFKVTSYDITEENDNTSKTANFKVKADKPKRIIILKKR